MAIYTVGTGCDYATVQAAFAALDLAPGDIVEVRADTPGGTKVFTESVTPGTNDSGADGNPVILRGRDGDNITIDGTTSAQAIMLASVNYFKIKNMRFVGGATYTIRLSSSNHTYLEDVVSENGPAPLFLTNNANNVFADRCFFKNSTTQSLVSVGSVVAATVRLNNCILQNSGLRSVYAYQNYAHDVELNNCVILGATNDGILNASPGIVKLTNTILAGANLNQSASYYPLNNTGSGSIIYKNCDLIPDYHNLRLATTGVVNDGGNVSEAPLYRSSRRPLIVGFMIDDMSNIDDWVELANWAKATHGIKVSYTFGSASPTTEQWGVINAMHALGHDSQPHGRTELVVTDMRGVTIQYIGSGTVATLSISGNTLIITVDGETDVNINLSPINLSQLAQAINANPDYTATITNTYGVPFASYLADVVSADITTAYAAGLDRAKVFAGEIVGSRSDFYANTGRNPAGYIYPTGAYDTAAINAIHGAGIPSARTIYGSSSWGMASIDMYKIRGIAAHSYIGTTNIERNVSAFLESAGVIGGYVHFYSHDFANQSGTGYSFEDWKTLIGAVAAYLKKNTNAMHMNYEEAIAYIIANGATADDGLTYTREFSDLSDYRLLKGSPCIRSGVDVGLTTDADGVTIPAGAGFDIGPYFYRPEVDAGFSPWSKCDSELPLSAQPCKGHALPIGVGKLTVFPGVASQGQIEEAK